MKKIKKKKNQNKIFKRFYKNDEHEEPDFDNILLLDVVNFLVQTNRDFRLFIHETETNTQVKLMNFIKDSFPNS